MSPTGMEPQQLNAIKVDLLRQFPSSVVQQALGQVGDLTPGQAGGMSGSTQPTGLSGAADLRTTVGQASGIAADRSKGQDKARVSSRTYDYFQGMPGMHYHIKPEQRELFDTATGAVAQRATSQADMFGGNFAQQQKLQDINAAMDEAV